MRQCSEVFFEASTLYDAAGQPTSVEAWRGVCHWLGLRHGSVQGLFFSPSRMAVLQRRADFVDDSPGFLDMTVAGHQGRRSVCEAIAAETHEETGIDLKRGSAHVAHSSDLEPILSYDFVQPPRPQDDFYNVEVRHVFAIRLSNAGMGALRPLDGEVSAFVLAPIAEARRMLVRGDVASALRISGPLALDHAAKKWHWQ
jgi:8-oxo-dGTP pyrophosphatase MutT (NUDIX family)